MTPQRTSDTGMVVRVGDEASKRVLSVEIDGFDAEGVIEFCGPPFVGDEGQYEGWVRRRVYSAAGTCTGDVQYRCKVRVRWSEE